MQRSRQAPAAEESCMVQRYGMTVPFAGPLHDQRARVRGVGGARLHRPVVGRGQHRRRIHSARAGIGVDAVAATGHGDPARLHPRPGAAGAIHRHDRRGRTGTFRRRHRRLVERHRRIVERHRIHRAVQACARHIALPAVRARGRKGQQRLRHVFRKGFPPRHRARATGPDPRRRVPRGHVAPGRT